MEVKDSDSMSYELEITKEQKKFNDWFYDRLRDFLRGDILEVGSGEGTFSERMIKEFKGKILLSEIDPNFIKILKNEFESGRVAVRKLDLNSESDFSEIPWKFDSVLMQNVLEHVKDDVLALKLLWGVLKDRGRLVIYVPCHKFLFCDLDRSLGHYRRYSKKELEVKARKAGFKIVKAFWFNMFGMPGRYIMGNIFKAKNTHGGSFRVFNKLVPIFRFLEERVFFNVVGVGRIIVIEKDDSKI